MKPTYKFRLREDATTYYYVDAAGNVATDSFPVDTKESIVDWDKLQMQWKRHSTYHGVFRSYMPEALKVGKYGAAILRYVFNTQGSIEALCELEILKLNTDSQEYEARGVCAIDFSQYQNSMLYVSVALMQGGLSARLQAYDTIDFTIPIGDPATDTTADYIWISGDPGPDPGGVLLLGQYNYQSQGSGATADIVLTDTPARPFQEQAAGMVYINREGEYTVAVNNNPLMGAAVDTWSGGVLTNMYALKAVQDSTVTFTGAFNFQTIASAFTSTQSLTLSLHAKVYRGESLASATLVSDTVIWTDPAGAISPGTIGSTLSTGILSHTENLVIGDMLVIAFRITAATSQAAGTSSQLQVTLDSEPTDLQISFEYRQPDTKCRALSQWQVFRKLFHALTEQTAIDPKSDLLTTDVYPGPEVYNLNPKFTFFTSGDALRELYVNAEGNPTDPSIKTNIKAFANDALVSNCAGIGIEYDDDGNEILRLEHLRHFYQKDVLIEDLGGNITNWRMTPYKDYIGNQIKAGYTTKIYDEVNGRFEFNVENILQAPVTRVHKDIDYKTEYRTGCYDAEYVRANLANKKTTDSENDNETYKFQSSGNRLAIDGVSPDPYQLDRAQTVTAGLPASVWPTVYNVPFTPWRQLGRLKPWLKSLYYGILNPILKFKTGTKNKDLISSMYTGPVVSESEDMDLTPDGTGEDILFKPFVFEFEAEVPINLPELMATNPYGVFRHTMIRRGVEYVLDGFVLEAGIVDGKRDTYEFKLLCSPLTDISGLM